MALKLEREIHDIPTAVEVRAALDQIIASDDFRRSVQLATFLRFVVEATLRGEGGRIKGYTIATEAFRRGDGFDPQTDPIVRVKQRGCGGRSDVITLDPAQWIRSSSSFRVAVTFQPSAVVA